MKMACPHCGVIGSAHDSLPGAKVRCPQCDKVFNVIEEEITCPHCAVTGSAFGSPVGTKLRCPRCEKVFLLTQEWLNGPLVSDRMIPGSMQEVVPTEAVIEVESVTLADVESVLTTEGMDISEQELATELDVRQSVPEMEAAAVFRSAFTGIQASPMAMDTSVGREEVVPTEVAIEAESVTLADVESVLTTEGMDISEQELATELDVRQSVPEMEAAAAAAPSFIGIQASPMAMELSEEAVVELTQEVVTNGAEVPEMPPELESRLALETVGELEPESEPEPEVEPELEVESEPEVEPEPEPEPVLEPEREIVSEPVLALEPELALVSGPEPEKVSALRPEEVVEPAAEIPLEPAMIAVPESVAELILTSAPEPAPEPAPAPEPEIVTEAVPEADSVVSVVEEPVPSEAGEQEPVAEEPAPPVLPTQICHGCGESFHPQLLQQVDGKLYCGVCQLRIAATTEPASRFSGGKLRAVLAAILLLGLMALIGLALIKLGIL